VSGLCFLKGLWSTLGIPYAWLLEQPSGHCIRTLSTPHLELPVLENYISVFLGWLEVYVIWASTESSRARMRFGVRVQYSEVVGGTNRSQWSNS
jgi:hypothetical protein